MKYANGPLLASSYHVTVTNCRSPRPRRSPNTRSPSLSLFASLSGSFDQKAVFLCDISMVRQTTGVNYSRIKLTIVSHLIQMLCFNKEPFRNIESISLLLKLRRLNKAWQRPVIRGNEAALHRTLSSCHRWASVKFDRLEQDCRGSHV